MSVALGAGFSRALCGERMQFLCRACSHSTLGESLCFTAFRVIASCNLNPFDVCVTYINELEIELLCLPKIRTQIATVSPQLQEKEIILRKPVREMKILDLLCFCPVVSRNPVIDLTRKLSTACPTTSQRWPRTGPPTAYGHVVKARA